MKRLFLFLFVLVLAGCQQVKPIPHPRPADPANTNPRDVSLNGLDLTNPGSQPYRFLVVGHLYGTPDRKDALPDKALLNKIPELKTAGLSMLVSLGDMVRTTTRENLDALDSKLLRQLSFPVFNIPGNHDVENREMYEARYGQTFYSFAYGPVRMIFLDTERENCSIDSIQQEMLSKALKLGLADPQTKNLFIFMHKTLFFQNDRLFQLKKKAAGPNVWDCYAPHNFMEMMHNIILPAAAKKPVYLFAGDVGARGNLTPYYELRTDSPVTMVMTGLGDSPQDSGILVSVDGAKVGLEVYPLAGKNMPSLETFTPQYWVRQAEGN